MNIIPIGHTLKGVCVRALDTFRWGLRGRAASWLSLTSIPGADPPPPYAYLRLCTGFYLRIYA